MGKDGHVSLRFTGGRRYNDTCSQTIVSEQRDAGLIAV